MHSSVHFLLKKVYCRDKNNNGKLQSTLFNILSPEDHNGIPDLNGYHCKIHVFIKRILFIKVVFAALFTHTHTQS